MKIRVRVGMVMLMMGCLQPLLAQEASCDLKLKLAKDYFDQGLLEEFEGDLTPSIEGCMLETFDSYQKLQAYRLFTIEALLTQNNAKADRYFTELLRIEPEFKIDLSQQTDPAELIYLYHDFRTRPLLSFDFHVGITNTQISGGERLSFDETTYIPEYLSNNGFALGAEVFLPFLTRNLGIVTGIDITRRNFAFSDQLSGGTAQSYTFSFVERESWLEVPIFLRYDIDYESKYNFKRKQLVPTIEGGVSLATLLRATFVDPTLDYGFSEIVTDPSLNVGEIRSLNQVFLYAGAGLKYKWNSRYFFVKARYSQGLLDQSVATDPNSALAQELYSKYNYQDVTFSVNGLGVSVGFEQPLYRPKRVKNLPRPFYSFEK